MFKNLQFKRLKESYEQKSVGHLLGVNAQVIAPCSCPVPIASLVPLEI